MSRTRLMLATGLALLAIGGIMWGRRMSASMSRKTNTSATIGGHAPNGQNSRHSAAQRRRQSPAISSWPCLLGPGHDSTSREAGVTLDWPASGPSEIWRHTVGTGYSAPVVWGRRLVLFHREGDEEIVECFDAADGERRWRFAYPTGYQCRFRYSNGPYSTPVLEPKRVYAWGAEGELHCLDRATGKRLWRRSLAADYRVEAGFFAVAASPLLENDRLILNVGGTSTGAGIVALDKLTGRTLWTATDQGASYATPVAATIQGRRLVFVFTAAGLTCLAPSDGRVMWSIPFCAKNEEKVNATSPVVSGDLVLVSGYSLGSLCVRVLADGSYRELWRDLRVLDSQYQNLLCSDGFVYGSSTIHRDLRCVELATGELQWEWPSELGRGALLGASGRMLFLSETGRLASLEVDARQPVVRSLTSLPVVPGPCYTAPALAAGRLFLRADRTLACFRLPAAKHRLPAAKQGLPAAR